MKKFLYIAAAAIVALSACTKAEIEAPETETAKAPVFTATIEGDAETKTTLGLNSTTGKYTKVNWEESGEEVKMLFANAAALEGESGGTFSSPVYQVTRSAEDASTATLTIKEGETYNSAADLFFAAVYPASIVTVDNSASSLADAVKYNFPATQVYKGDGKIGFAPMLGPNPGFHTFPPDLSLPQLFTFGNACALLEITVPYTEMTSVRSITVSSDLRMNGEIEVEGLEYFCFKNPSNPGDGENQVTLDCYSLDNANVAIPEGGSKTFYVSIVPREKVTTAPYLKYLQIDVTDGTTTKTMRTKTFEGTNASGIEIKQNKIYPIAFEKNYDTNLLPGKFSVSATKKVQFTKSNLYWDGSAYQFEANQTAYPTAWNTSHVGLFFWNSHDEYITTKNGYKPYYSSYGHLSSWSPSDVFWCGEANKLEVAGTQGLYVLSAAEWHYLTGMFTYASYSDVRSDANRFALAMVNGKAGLLIFPDGYNGTTPVAGITGIAEVNNDYTAYPTESITDNAWSAMEAAGVVFLPAAGYRGETDGQTISSGYCQYWSSTPYDNSSAKDEEYAYGLFGTDTGDFKCPGKIQRKNGSSIRLVKTVE